MPSETQSRSEDQRERHVLQYNQHLQTPGQQESQLPSTGQKKFKLFKTVDDRFDEACDNPIEQFPLAGYRKLAVLMGMQNSTIPIFRRFGSLNMLNLMSLQAELLELQQIFVDQCSVDDGMRLRQHLAFSFMDLRDKDEAGALREQWECFLPIREKLKEYSA